MEENLNFMEMAEPIENFWDNDTSIMGTWIEPDIKPQEVAINEAPPINGIERLIELSRKKHLLEEKDNDKKKIPLLVEVTDKLVEYDLIRDESYEVYFYDGGYYHQADNITLAIFIKQNLPSGIIDRITTPSFYEKVRLNLKSDNRLKIVSRTRQNDDTKYKVVFQDGIYDCRSGCFLDFSPQYLLFSKLNVLFKRRPCADRFQKFLHEVSGGDRLIETEVWEMIAYLLLPTNDGKCFFMLGVAPNSGKSLLLKIIEAMFSEADINRASLKSISGRFALSSIAGKRINIAPECVDERISAEIVNNIKILTGEETTNVEKKGKNPVREYIRCKLVFATNAGISFGVRDDAFWNRMRIVPFMHSIPQEQQDTDLYSELLEELDDIATIAITKYAGDLIRSNYSFTCPEYAKDMMRQWRNSRLDILKDFLDEICIITRNMEDYVSVGHLYDKYIEWLDKNNESQPFAKADFGRKVRENFIGCIEPRIKEKIDGVYERVFHGIRLR